MPRLLGTPRFPPSSRAGWPSASALTTPHPAFSSSPLLGPPPSKDRHCFGSRALDSWNKLCLSTFLDTDVSNPMEYEFNFQLEIRGPCLLAGEWEPPRPRWGWREDLGSQGGDSRGGRRLWPARMEGSLKLMKPYGPPVSCSPTCCPGGDLPRTGFKALPTPTSVASWGKCPRGRGSPWSSRPQPQSCFLVPLA